MRVGVFVLMAIGSAACSSDTCLHAWCIAGSEADAPVEDGAAPEPAQDASDDGSALSDAERDASDTERDAGASDAELDAGASDAADAIAADAELRDASDAREAGSSATCQVDTSDSGIAGLSIHIEGARCTIPYGQGGTFEYRVALDRALSYHVPAPVVGCGNCRSFGASLTSLVHTTIIGANLSYCPDCDVGCCEPPPEATHELAPQSIAGTFTWSGRSWNGASDTGQPMGDFFPAGEYFVTITVSTPDGKSAAARLPIHVQAP